MCRMMKYDAEIKPPGGFRRVKSTASPQTPSCLLTRFARLTKHLAKLGENDLTTLKSLFQALLWNSECIRKPGWYMCVLLSSKTDHTIIWLDWAWECYKSVDKRETTHHILDLIPNINRYEWKSENWKTFS